MGRLAIVGCALGGSACIVTGGGSTGSGASAEGANSDAPGAHGAGGGGGASGGTFFHTFAGKLFALDVASGAEVDTRLPDPVNPSVGFGGGYIANIEDPNDGTTKIVLRRFRNNAFEIAESFTVDFRAENVWGVAVPSPDAALFVMETREVDEPGADAVYYVRAVDRRGKMIGRIPGVTPAWLAKGRAIFARGDGLFVVDVTSSSIGAPQRIGKAGLGSPGSAAAQPSISADGTAITFWQANMIWRMNLDGTSLTQVTAQGDEQGNPIFSPDGTQIVVQRGDCRTLWGTEYVVPSTPSGAPPDVRSVETRITALRPDLSKTQRFDVPACGPVFWGAL